MRIRFAEEGYPQKSRVGNILAQGAIQSITSAMDVVSSRRVEIVMSVLSKVADVSFSLHIIH